VTNPLRSGTVLRDSTAARQTIKLFGTCPARLSVLPPRPPVVPPRLPVVRFFLRCAPECNKKTPHRADEEKTIESGVAVYVVRCLKCTKDTPVGEGPNQRAYFGRDCVLRLLSRRKYEALGKVQGNRRFYKFIQEGAPLLFLL
jgi:hypothetical protein